ncbi:MAG: outer membrane protein assembly factor BamD, partial [Bacteroidota bacterium]|nr:outer membrane protein assembly factor BamD [Bacteroidota bacterium]
QFKSAAILAINSVFSKKEERLDNAVAYYDDFIRSYPDSEFIEQTNSIRNDIEKEFTTFASN